MISTPMSWIRRLEQFVPSGSLTKGRNYFRSGAVEIHEASADRVEATVKGGGRYWVVLDLDVDLQEAASHQCPGGHHAAHWRNSRRKAAHYLLGRCFPVAVRRRTGDPGRCPAVEKERGVGQTCFSGNLDPASVPAGHRRSTDACASLGISRSVQLLPVLPLTRTGFRSIPASVISRRSRSAGIHAVRNGAIFLKALPAARRAVASPVGRCFAMVFQG